MAKKLDPSETTSWTEIAHSNMIHNEAVLRLLIKKGIITKEEFTEEIKKVYQEMYQKKGKD